MSNSLRFTLFCIATVVSIHFCVDTGLISGWNRWYSPSIQYREQTEALLSGHFALSNSPTALEFDMAWANGGVQQVWGLGVPIWRLPFEALARLFGEQAFPDRLELAAAIVVAGYFVLKSFTAAPTVSGVRDWFNHLRDHPLRLVASLVLIAFPPIITLCNGRFDVYEEATLYQYYFCIALLAGTLLFAQSPTLISYIVLSCVAAFGGFVRPTVLAYSFSSVLISFYISRRASWTWWKSLLGPGLLVVGVVILSWSNSVRFGSFLEFGHHLNLSGREMKYISRFPAPFDNVPAWPAAKELFGSMFFVRTLNGYADAYQDGLVAWQSSALRWRCFYTTTFDLSYLLALTACWIWAVSVVVKMRRASGVRVPIELLIPALWSFFSIVPLFGFHLHYCAMSSRYMLDFAPAIGAAIGSCMLATENTSRDGSLLNVVPRAVLIAVAVVWWFCETAVSENIFAHNTCLSQSQIVEVIHHKRPNMLPLPDHYELDTDPAEITGIDDNGSGWEHPLGDTSSIVVLFVQDAKKITLEVAPNPRKLLDDDYYAAVQMKIGLESLPLESIKDTGHGSKLLTFAAPKQDAYRSGLQTVFVTFVPPTRFREEISPFRLLRVDWN